MNIFSLRKSSAMVTPQDALPGRDERPFPLPASHAVLGTPLECPDGFPPDLEKIYVAMGCFWGAERRMWRLPGVYTTAVGYQGGYTPNPTYSEVCTGRTGHAEAVLVVYDPKQLPLYELLKVFWENHDPTQGMRQGNDVGTQYRSAVYTTSETQAAAVTASAAMYQARLTAAGYGSITTEVGPLGEFWYAEPYHQQYLAKNPGGYCGIGGTGVSCPIGVATA